MAPATSSADVVRYAASATADPLTPTAQQERKEAMSFAEKDHSSHVLLCAPLFEEMTANHQANAQEITLEYVISAAAFLYQHPEAASDSVQQNAAGVDAALKVYTEYLTKDSHTRSKTLDGLVEASRRQTHFLHCEHV